MSHSGVTVEGAVLVPGRAVARVLVLEEPLSFWGGVDPTSGQIVDTHHPQVGETITGRVLVLPGGRGSSSSSSILAETIRSRIGPAAMLLATNDPILALGAFVAEEIYGVRMPMVVLDADAYRICAAAHELIVNAAPCALRATIQVLT
jgi:predicted aconitase with swiveling domain